MVAEAQRRLRDMGSRGEMLEIKGHPRFNHNYKQCAISQGLPGLSVCLTVQQGQECCVPFVLTGLECGNALKSLSGSETGR